MERTRSLPVESKQKLWVSDDGSRSFRRSGAQLTKTQSGNQETTFGFNDKGFPTSIVTPGITNWSYLFDSKGNLASRTDSIANYKDSIAYDALNRLISWKVYQGNTLQQTNSMGYDPLTSNIQTKSDLDSYTMSYGEDGQPPHALTSISGMPSIISNANQTISYTDFSKVKQITEGGNGLTISYGTDEQRIKTVLTGSSGSLTRYYMGDYEEEVRNGNTRKIHYITGGNGLAAIYVQNNGNDTLYYVHTDFQGSLTALSLQDGTIKERYAYDPWGNRRNPANWTQRDARTAFIFNRGYTMHEHLPEFALINMNGRVYDPLASIFLSTDPNLQSPEDWLNFNRFSYALNNPFKYTDPNGEWFGIDDLLIAGAGFVFGYVGYGISTGNWGWSAIAAGGIGAVTTWLGYNTAGLSTATWALGQGITSATWNFMSSMAINSVASQVIPPINIPISDKFGISISPVAMMTGFKGSDIRFGVGVTASYRIGDWTLSAGTDFLRAAGRTGFGTYYGGFSYDDGKNGFSFYATKYMYGAKQASGIFSGHIGDFSASFEDDIFGVLSGGGKHDRYRTAALELGYKNFSVGTQLITNDPKGEGSDTDPTYTKNKKGQWDSGYQLLSALYVGYSNKNSVIRMGINSKLGGYLGQNWWHRHVFSTPDYKYVWDNNSPFYQMGTRQFYTLY